MKDLKIQTLLGIVCNAKMGFSPFCITDPFVTQILDLLSPKPQDTFHSSPLKALSLNLK